jgi:hypothetical protein
MGPREGKSSMFCNIERFAKFAELEEQLRAALNGEVDLGADVPRLTKTAQKKLAKAALKRRTVVHRPLVRSVAHIVVSCRNLWGGLPIKIDYVHTNCSLFEAQMAVDRMISKQGLIFHALLKKEVCDVESRIVS